MLAIKCVVNLEDCKNTKVGLHPPSIPWRVGRFAYMAGLVAGELPPLILNNVVVTFTLGVDSINLAELSTLAPFFSYDSNHFAAAICHLDSPSATCLLFNTGRGVCAGTRSVLHAHLAVTRVISLLQHCDIWWPRLTNFVIRNVVASAQCGFTVDLEKMASELSSECIYHAGVFPGLRYRPGTSGGGSKRSAVLVYRNGGIVLTGNSSVEECEALWPRAFSTVKQYFTEMPVGQETSAEYRRRCATKDDDMEEIINATFNTGDRAHFEGGDGELAAGSYQEVVTEISSGCNATFTSNAEEWDLSRTEVRREQAISNMSIMANPVLK